MKTKRYFITITICVFTLLFAIDFVFASNIGREVYGVLTETYAGASIDNPSAGEDYVKMPGSGYNNSDRKEGTVSTSIGYKYWFGIMFNTPQDMSAYIGGRLYFSAKVPTTVNIDDTGNNIKLSDGVDRILYFNSENIKRIDDGPTTEVLGTKISNDNEWHTYYIELSSFTGLQLANITYLFIVGSPVNDNTILIDNVYWTKAPSQPRSFTVTVKNISNNQIREEDDITWSQSAFRQNWIVADQYIELDLDQESSNWYVRVYLDNDDAGRKGLWCRDGGVDRVLPMAWRISRDLLPDSSGETLQIKQDANYKLYDSGGKYTPDGAGKVWWYPWAYCHDITDPEMVLDNTIVWDLRGCHTFIYDNDKWEGFVAYERKPKIYFAADCSSALGGLIYRANVVTELVFE